MPYRTGRCVVCVHACINMPISVLRGDKKKNQLVFISKVPPCPVILSHLEIRHSKAARSSCKDYSWTGRRMGAKRHEAGDKTERMGGKCTPGEMIGPACTQASRAGVSQPGACAVNPDSCKQSGRQTGLEVERLSQIRTQCTDQPGIHMCLFNKSALLCPDMPQRQCLFVFV